MRYQRNRGGVYATGLGLLALLICVGIGLWIWVESANVSMNSYNRGVQSLDKALELGEQVANQAHQRNRDPSRAPAGETVNNSASNGGASNGGTSNDIGVAPISPAAPGIVTPPVINPPPAPAAKKVTENVPRQMPDHGANKLIEEME